MMRYRINHIIRQCILLIYSIFSYISCDNDNLDIVSIRIELPSFKEVKFISVFDVYFLHDTISYMDINGCKEYVDQVSWYMDKNELVIQNNSSFKFINPDNNSIKLYLYTDSLSKIKTNESCTIHSIDTIVSNTLNLVFASRIIEANLDVNCHTLSYMNYFPCGGKLTLRGQSYNLNIWNSALMAIDAKDFVSNNALVKNNSKGICEIQVLEKLEYSIHGEGDIYLFNMPAQVIADEITSTGRLVLKY